MRACAAYEYIVDALSAINKLYACVAELVDALASGASVLRDVEVQVLSRVPNKKETSESLFDLVHRDCKNAR